LAGQFVEEPFVGEDARLDRTGRAAELGRQAPQSRQEIPMARTRVMYIEQKTDGNRNLEDRGPAEIGEVSFSKTGRTVYYKGKSFRRIEGGGVYGNYVCPEDGNEYWITGVKKRGSNRHPAGSGPVVDTTGGEAAEA
jgi:hypothetical protein